MRIELLTIVAALGVASSAVAQGPDQPVDGSAPGKVLLVLRELPPGKPALIVREPPNSNGHVRQRSIIYFSPRGTPGELALALAAFDRIRREHGEVITQPSSNALTLSPQLGMPRPASGDPVEDSVIKARENVYLGEMQGLLDFVHSVPARVVPGIGKVQWIQVDRPPLVKGPR